MKKISFALMCIIMLFAACSQEQDDFLEINSDNALELRAAVPATVFKFSTVTDFRLPWILVSGNVKVVVDGKLAYSGSVASAPKTLRGKVFEVTADKLDLFLVFVKEFETLESIHLVDIEYTNVRLNPKLKEITLGGVPYFSDKSLTYTFFGTAITSIPSGLLDNCPNVREFDATFGNCVNLKTIPADLFDKCPQVTTFCMTFVYSTGITKIPVGLFDNNPNVTEFFRVFDDCKNVTSIPVGLFDKNSKVIKFAGVFRGSGITGIPSGLFDKHPDATLFYWAFENCSNLTSIPVNLFAKCPKVTDFGYVFNNCPKVSSNVPELWLSHPNAANSGAFSGCTNAANYVSIPTVWKTRH